MPDSKRATRRPAEGADSDGDSVRGMVGAEAAALTMLGEAAMGMAVVSAGATASVRVEGTVGDRGMLIAGGPAAKNRQQPRNFATRL